MQTMQCPDTLAFVEGTMERAFLNLKFPRFVVIPLSNGDTWTTDRMCEQVISKFKARNTFPDNIIVWFDREKNPDSVQHIEAALRQAFNSVNYPQHRLHCLIPDRMSENIILSDETLISQEIGDANYTYPGDGAAGKGFIKNLFARTGKDYKETTHGTKLLGKVRLSRCGKNASVAAFLNTFKHPCWII